MPFTLSHPITVLAAPKSRYLHQGALIIGSMAPDFINYLNIVNFTKFGHTTMGAFILDLPLCFIVYYLYLYLIAPYFWRNLPDALSLQTDEQPITTLRMTVIFFLSALIGIFSHILLDWLLHKSSDLLVTFDFIQPYHHGLRIYRLYHFSISVLGLLIILFYLRYRVSKQIVKLQTPAREKWQYWQLVLPTMLIILLVWELISPISYSIDRRVVRVVDGGFLALLLVGTRQRIVHKRIFF